MPRLIKLRSIIAKGGSLTVIQDEVPFLIKRVFYIHGPGNTRRGEHRHKTTVQLAVSVGGSCVIDTNNGFTQESWQLDAPDKLLLLEPEDWHVMHTFSHDAVLMVLASTTFDPDDYIYEPYHNGN